MADLAITALPTASQLSSSDLLYVAIPNPLSPIGFSLCKMTSAQFGLFLNKDLLFASDLETDSKNIIGAINELKAGGGGGGASVIQLTQAEYTALTSGEKMNGSIYKLTDKAVMLCLDEEYHPVKELTTAQYEALSTAEQNNGTIYIQTDAETTGEDIPVNTLTPDTSINSAINACFGRTGSDIPVSTGETETIADKLDSLSTPDIHAVKGSYSGIKGVYGGYISGSRNYFDFFIPCNTNGLTAITNVSFNSISVLTANGRSDNPFSSYSVDVTPMGLFVDCRYSSTQAASISGVVTFDGLAFTAS